MSHESVENCSLFISSYRLYLELGGTLSEKDYDAVKTMCNFSVFNRVNQSIKNLTGQAKTMARFSKIFIIDTENFLDQRVALYAVLRSDSVTEKKINQYTMMGDQRLFGEVLRILGDLDSLKKLVYAHPNISF